MNREQLEQLAKNLGVEFTDETSDEDLFTSVAEASTREPEPSNEPGSQGGNENEPEPQPVLASEEELKKLAETNPAVRLLLTERERQNQRLAALEVSNRLSEVRVKLADVDTKDYALAPKYRDKLQGLAVKLSENDSDTLIELVKGIVKDGRVELGERGKGRNTGETTQLDDAAHPFDAEVKKLMEANKDLDFADAVEQVALADPNLFAEYRQSAYANDELRGDR